jgi:pseudouridine-5'-phosphate glycosidase/pseudouridine kinase
MTALLPYVAEFWVKASHRGVLHLHITPRSPKQSNTMSYPLTGIHEGKHLILTHYPAPKIPEDEIVSTTGAGDTLIGGLVAGLVSEQVEDEAVWVGRALERVERTIRSNRAVG